MDIATGAMTTLLPKLAQLVVGEYKLQTGVKGEIEDLKKELWCIYAALVKVSEVPAEKLDVVAKLWARDARELSYDIEDAVDRFMLCGKGHEDTSKFSVMGFIRKIADLGEQAKNKHQIHDVIKDIMEQVKKITDRHDRWSRSLDELAAGPPKVTVDPRLEGMYRKVTELVGIGGPKAELAKKLRDEDSSSLEQPKIISIVGFGGLGKTTLANALLKDLKAEFDCHVFVSVSLKPDMKMILKSIHDQIGKNSNEASEEIMQLINNIRASLEHKRCLCVIDDVWDVPAWDIIKVALQDAKGSKIIITTRNKAVAEHAGGAVYELKPLSPDDARKLINSRIFNSIDGCPPDLNEVSEKILKKCGGVPLAIITISSLLATKPRTSQEWEKVNKYIGRGLGENLHVDKMRKILGLSYYDLPPHLKTCLLSLSKYPEDKIIRKDVLVWSWMAEGFIAENGQPFEASMKEKGDSYFNELVNRSLIQPVDILHFSEQDGQVDACQIHDMVLDLVSQLAAQEGFVTTIYSEGQQADTSTVLKNKIRRLALHNNCTLHGLTNAREQLSHIRSLAVFGEVKVMPPLSCFHVLRVLDLDDCAELRSNHLKDICELHLLRFLRLRRLNVEELPESIGKLEFLETLDIRVTKSRGSILLPVSFGNLVQLVRLLADGVRLPRRITLKKMRSLQELLGIFITQDAAKEISNLTELRVLGCIVRVTFRRENENLEEFLKSCVRNCINLKELDISGFDRQIERICFPSSLQKFTSTHEFMEYPSWINSSLSCLTILSLRLEGEWLILPKRLEVLAGLPSLCFLRLSVSTSGSLRQKINIRSSVCGFRSLREFHFYSSLMFIKFQPGAMPNLQRLYLKFHARTTTNFDFGLQNLQSLRHVFVHFIEKPGSREAEAVMREALKHNPHHPSLDVINVHKYARQVL
ncbi:hypothetical protein ACP4OV_028121 [Aristida adscensionis]